MMGLLRSAERSEAVKRSFPRNSFEQRLKYRHNLELFLPRVASQRIEMDPTRRSARICLLIRI